MLRTIFEIVGAMTLGTIAAAMLWAVGEVVAGVARSMRRRRQAERERVQRIRERTDHDWLGV